MAQHPSCIQVRFDHSTMWVELNDGRKLAIALTDFPRLLRASPTQRRNYTLSGGGAELHWNELDEDISVGGLLQKNTENTPSKY